MLTIAALAFGSWLAPASAAPITTWCIAGNWQDDDLNNPTTPGDEWNPNYHNLYDDGTNGDATSNDGIFSYSTQLPAGTYETKVVGACDWVNGSFPNDNYSFNLDAPGTVTFSFNTISQADGWYPDQYIVHVDGADWPVSADTFVAVGDWQSEAGSTDWDNTDIETAMIDTGGGMWLGEFVVNASGNYLAKINEFNSNYGYDATGRSIMGFGNDVGFNVSAAGNIVRFKLDLTTSRWTVEEDTPLNWCVYGDFNSWDTTANPLYDDGTNGDATANDGIYSYEYTEANTGTYNFRVLECNNSGNQYPSLEASFYTTTSANQSVLFTFDTNTVGDGFFPQQYITNTVGDTEMTGPFYGVGNWQAAAGNPDGNWDETMPTTQLWDDGTNGDASAGDGIFYGEFPIDTVGNYIGRVTVLDTWDRYDKQGLHRAADSADFDFSIATANEPVTITLDVNQSRLKYEGSTVELPTTYCAAGEFQGASWDPTTHQMVDDGTNGDAIANDGVYTYELDTSASNTSQPGTYGWKVAENCQWGTEYPGGAFIDSWYRIHTADETILLTIDTKDYSGDAFKPDTNILSSTDLDGEDFVVTGTFQPGGTPDSSDTNYQMVDDGSDPNDTANDGIYTLTISSLAQGGYTAQIAELNGDALELDENLGRLRGASPFLVIVGSGGSDVIFEYDRNTDRVSIDVANASSGIDNNLQWADMYHDSRDANYRSPTGPIGLDGTDDDVTITFRTAENDAEIVLFRYYDDVANQNIIEAMTKVNTNGGYDYYEYTMPAPSGPNAYYYWFLVVDGSAQAYYQDAPDPGGVLTGGIGETRSDNADYSWQVTYYDPAFQTPDWVKNAVIYQIFPDRFRDGDSSNNPPGGDFFYNEAPTIVRSLDSEGDWNTPICDPRDTTGTDCDNSYSRNFYGGDLQGITEMIESGYFNELGVTALYLNPIFESPSNHKYDTFDFMEVDDNFGGKQAYDDMIAAADAAGIHIILDSVFNHASSDSVYFDRYERWDVDGNSTGAPGAVDDNSGACEDETGTTSPWADWFDFFTYSGMGTAPCDGNRDYPYWFGIFDSLAVFDSTNPDVQDYFFADGLNSVGPYWIDQGASGWRLDVAPEIDHGRLNEPNNMYWEGFRDAVHQVDPDAYIVGEEWAVATSWTIGGDNGTGSVGEWDATMNYQFGAATMSFFRDTEFVDNDFNEGSSARKLTPLTPSQWNERMLNLMERYPPEAFAAMMNLFGSHDTNRVIFLLNHDANMTGNVAQMEADMLDPNYDWSDAIERMKGATLIQMTMPGAPTIYYGNEVGLVGPVGHDGSQWQDDPYNRQPYPWLDESGTPLYTHLQDANNQQAVYDYFSLLAAARNASPALRTGEYTPLLLDDGNMVLAYARHNAEGDLAVVIVNRGNAVQDVTVDLGSLGSDIGFVDVLTDTIHTATGTSLTVQDVPVNGGALLIVSTTPDTPSDLTATYDGTNNDIGLTWTDNADNENYYVVEVSTDDGSTWDVLTDMLALNSSSYTHSPVECGTTYTYRVKATNIFGESSYSPEAEADTPICAIDGNPTDLTATYNANDDAIDLTWTDNTTTEENYTAEVSTDDGATWTVLDAALPADTTSYTHTPVDCGTTYTYRVKATNAGGESAYSPVASADTPVCLPDSAPTDLSATYQPAPHVTILFWQDNASNEAGYLIERTKADETNWIVLDTTAANADGFTDDTVTCEQNYIYRVTAVNATGSSDAIMSDVVNTECNIFTDVPSSEQPPFFEAWIEDFYQAGITTGCNDGVEGETLEFCPTTEVNRGQMAVFILRALNYPDTYMPTGIDPNPFTDVPSPNLPPIFEAWIEDFLSLGITTGCNPAGTLFCPEVTVDRAQMAVFILRAIEGPDYVPVDDPDDPFVDVPSPNQPPMWEAWIEDFYNRGITTGCNDGIEGETLEFCPEASVDRGQMAVFILRAFDNIPNPNDP